MVDAIVCSPPYAEAVGSPALGGWRRAGWGQGGDICARQGLTADYGTTPGQLGALKAGEVQAVIDAIVCSPPYAHSKPDHWTAEDRERYDRLVREGKARGNVSGKNCNAAREDTHYGVTPGQVGVLRDGEPPGGEDIMADIPIVDFYNCYARGWGRDVLVPAAMSHPAKFARGLLTRLFDHGFERDWWAKGSLVADPFAGVACGGIVAAYKGLRWIGCELEPKFHSLALANIALHRANWEALGDPVPVCLLGDSRAFASLVAGCGAVLTSPPWADGGMGDERFGGGLKDRSPVARRATGGGGLTDYGTSPGQVGALPAGDVGAVVTSPPYADSMDAAKTEEHFARQRLRMKARGVPLGGGQLTYDNRYGASDGQVGRESGETYWSACKQIYLECLKALRPNGVMCVVVKGYVRGGALVDLPGQTLRLLCALGFEPVERIRAWLTEERREAGLFGEVVTTKSRASFFRRLAEKRGAPPIRWEEVLVVRKGTDRFDAPAAKED